MRLSVVIPAYIIHFNFLSDRMPNRINCLDLKPTALNHKVKNCRIHCFINYCMLSGFSTSKAAPDHQTTVMFDGGYYLFLKCCSNLMPGVKVHTPLRKVSLHIFPKVSGIIMTFFFFGKCETGLCFLCQQFFWHKKNARRTGTLPFAQFLFILVNHEL